MCSYLITLHHLDTYRLPLVDSYGSSAVPPLTSYPRGSGGRVYGEQGDMVLVTIALIWATLCHKLEFLVNDKLIDP
jgi:hypothetical protein